MISPQTIKQARKDAGLTQSQAAAIVSRTLNCWQKWEAGQRRIDPAMWELFLLKVKQPK